MNNLQRLFQLIKGFKNQFVRINNYVSKTTGEVANYTIQVGLNVENAKKKDLEKLQACNISKLSEISKKLSIDLDTCQTALSELTDSAIKNLNPDVNKRTNASKGQTKAYTVLTSGFKVLTDDYEKVMFQGIDINTIDVYVFGQRIKKEVIEKGVYKTVNSRPKTIAKNEIKKALNLTSHKFRNFVAGNISTANIQGEQLQF